MNNAQRACTVVTAALPALLGLACAGEGINAGGGKPCREGGKIYKPGETFSADCNTCTCTADGVVQCTLMGCPGTGGWASLGGAGGAGGLVGTGGSATGGALGMGGSSAYGTGAGGTTVPADAGLAEACTQDGKSHQIGESFKRDCNTCTCTVHGIACTDMACWGDGGEDVVRALDSGVGCTFGGTTLLPGQSTFDGCNTCACGDDGRMMCTERACLKPDAALPVDSAPSSCALSSNLTFGHDGGMVIYQDTNRLTATTFTITRTYMRGIGPDGASASTCAPKLPACGTSGIVNVATIAADLADAEVQAAFAGAQASGTLYGSDSRPADGTVYAIALDDGRKLLVGRQCASPVMSSCRSIPEGVLRLANDLMTLASVMATDPGCAGL